MLRWFSAEESGPPPAAPDLLPTEMGANARLSDEKEQREQMQELVSHLKEMIREKDAALCSRDEHLKEVAEQVQLLQNERESSQSKLEAERHMARARLGALMEKQEVDLRRAAEKHEAEMAEREQALRRQLETLQRSLTLPAEAQPSLSSSLTTQLQAQVKLKEAEASKAESKFLKMKAWSKSRIRQLEEELKRVQMGRNMETSTDTASLQRRITELQEEREELLTRLEVQEEIKIRNEELQKQLLEFKEQQWKMQADLEQVTQRAAQASDRCLEDVQMMEWQEMVTMVTEEEQNQDEKSGMAFRISHMEEEREALANRRQEQETEEDLAQVRGASSTLKNRTTEYFTPRSLQEEFAHTQAVMGHSDALLNGENMGGWWPQPSAGDTDGLRCVVEELELERNRLQEQIMALEKQCEDLEERMQLQARVELLQNESERLRSQLATLRNQQREESEKHQRLVSMLNKQVKGLSSTQECLESSLLEKEHTLARTSEKLEHIESLREALEIRDQQINEQVERILQTEHSLVEVKKTCSSFERENSELKLTVADLTTKLCVMKDKTQKQESSIELLQSDLLQTSEDLERLNTVHLEERSQLLHDLQGCEREIDRLQDALTDKDKEILALSSSMAEFSEQIHELKQEVKRKEEVMSIVEESVQICRDPELSDQQFFSSLIKQIKKTEGDLKVERDEAESRRREFRNLMRQMEEDQKTIKELQTELQKITREHQPDSEQGRNRDLLLEEHMFEKQKGELLVITKQLEELKRDTEEKSSLVKTLQIERENLNSECRVQHETKDLLEKKVSDTEDRVRSLEMDNHELTKSLDQHMKELRIRDEAKDILEKKLSETEESVRSLKTDNQKLCKSLEQHQEELRIRDKAKDDLEKKLSRTEDSIRSFEMDNHELKKFLEDGLKELRIQDEAKDVTEKKLSDTEERFTSLEMDNHELKNSLEQRLEELRIRDEAKVDLEKKLYKATENVRSLEVDNQKFKKSLEQNLEELTKFQQHLEKASVETEMVQEQKSSILLQLESISRENSQLKLELESHAEISVENARLLSKQSEHAKATEDLMRDQHHLFQREAELQEELRRSLHSLEEAMVEKEGLLRLQEDLTSQNRNLEEMLEKKKQEVLKLTQTLSEGETRMMGTLKESERNLEQKNEIQKVLTETVEERATLIQTQDVEIRNLTEDLLKAKKQGRTSQERLQDTAETLKQKSSECVVLTKALQKTNDEVEHLRCMLESSSNEALYHQKIVLERDRLLSDHETQIEMSRKHLQDLEKQLTEKSLLLQQASEASSLLQDEVRRQKEQVCCLQEEMCSLKDKCYDVNQALETKEKALMEKTLECNKRNESLVSLTSQLGLMNGNTVKLESEKANLKNSLEQQKEEDAKLKEELSQIRLELVEHQDENQALMEQNKVIKFELKNSVIRDRERITFLQNELESRSKEMACLEERFTSEMVTLTKAFDEKVENAKTLAMSESRTRVQLESESQISQSALKIQEESQHLRNALQIKDRELFSVKAMVENCEAKLREEIGIKSKLQEDAKHLEEQCKQFIKSMHERDSLFMQEKEKYIRLQSRTSELELSVEQMKHLMGEKDQVLNSAQSQIQRLEDLSKCLQEEGARTKKELLSAVSGRGLMEEEIRKITHEKEEILRNSSSQFQRVQELVQELNWQSNHGKGDLVMEQRPRVMETIALQSVDASPEPWVQLRSHLQQCHHEIQRSESAIQQLNSSVVQTVQEKQSLDSQLSSVSRMLKDSQQTVGELQNHCYWLERQLQTQYSPLQQSSVPPGAPQERIRASFSPDGSEARDLRARLSEAELCLSQVNSRLEEEQSRRETAEESLRLHQQRAGGLAPGRSGVEVSVQLERDEEQFEELIIRPNRRLFISKMQSGLHLCQRLLKGRSAHSCSRLLRSRLKPRFLFLGYILLLHFLLLMCFSSGL